MESEGIKWSCETIKFLVQLVHTDDKEIISIIGNLRFLYSPLVGVACDLSDIYSKLLQPCKSSRNHWIRRYLLQGLKTMKKSIQNRGNGTYDPMTHCFQDKPSKLFCSQYLYFICKGVMNDSVLEYTATLEKLFTYFDECENSPGN